MLEFRSKATSSGFCSQGSYNIGMCRGFVFWDNGKKREMKITILAGGMALAASDIASAKKLINEQRAQGEAVSFTVDCNDLKVRKHVEDELNAQIAKWNPNVQPQPQDSPVSDGIAQSESSHQEIEPAPVMSTESKHPEQRPAIKPIRELSSIEFLELRHGLLRGDAVPYSRAENHHRNKPT